MKRIDSFSALTYVPFARLFVGATVSNIGTWIETVAVGIYLQSTTGDARLVAMGAAAAYLPHALMGLFSGAIADRFSRQKILIFNNLSACSIAIFLAIAVSTSLASPALVIACLFVTGFLNAVSFPTWQAFLADIVPNDKVPGALTLMMAQWNSGRIVGPIFAALLLQNENYSLAFSVNAATFIAVSAMLLLIKPHHYQKDIHLFKDKVKSKSGLIFGGWIYIFSKESGLRKPYLVFVSFIFFASPFIALIPNIAEEVFDNRNTGTSLLTTFQGIGAVVVAVLITALQIKLGATRLQRIFLVGASVAFAILAISPNLYVGSLAAFIFGISYAGSITSTTVAGQISSGRNLRGRVAASFMSTIGLIFPIASILSGFIVNSIGPRTYFGFTAIILITVLTFMGAFSKSYRLPSAYKEPLKD